MPEPIVLIVEDSTDRIARFHAAANGVARLHVWRSVHAFRAESAPLLAHAAAISLDHDLYAPPDESDPGDGVDAARFLASRPPTCPVIVHSSNVDRAYAMIGDLENAGWMTRRVGAFGPDWIEADWLPVLRELLAGG